MNEELYMTMDLYGADSEFSYQTVWCVTIEDVFTLPSADEYNTEISTDETSWTIEESDSVESELVSE